MPSRRPGRVAVIGAGISGVTTAAHLKNEGLDVTVFERSKAAGGTWLFDDRKPLEPSYPSVLASKADKYDDLKASVDDADLERLLHAPPGPCYVGLKNNVETRLLETTLNPFPPGTPDFVSHDILKNYIQDTASKAGVEELTRYDTDVKNLSKSGNKWIVESVTLSTKADGNVLRPSIEEFDSVVIASGHYHAARVPDILGLADWKRQWPQRVQHSKAYRRPEDFKGKNFLLIGGSVSSMDIARELSPFASTIYQSHRNGAFDLPASLIPENAVRVDEVTLFDGSSSSSTTASLDELDSIPATITLKSGRELCDIHHVILCTGYNITLPFLRHLHADETPPEKADDTVLVTDGLQIHNLHQDIFYIPDPSLTFVGVPYFTATFTLFEFQAMVVAKVLNRQARLPSEGAMRTEYQQRVKTKGYGRSLHSLRDKEVEYVDELLDWINRDLEEAGVSKLGGHTIAWKEAKAEQVERMKIMFSGPPGPERELEIVCS